MIKKREEQNMNYGQVLELDEITLDDCDTYLYGLGKRVVINDGHIINLVNEGMQYVGVNG